MREYLLATLLGMGLCIPLWGQPQDHDSLTAVLATDLSTEDRLLTYLELGRIWMPRDTKRGIEYLQQADSLLAHTDSEKAHAYVAYTQGFRCFYQTKYDSVAYFSQRVLSMELVAEDDWLKNATLNLLAIGKSELGDLDSAEYYYRQVYFEDPDKQANTHRNLANLLARKGRSDEAKALFQEVMHLYDSLGNTPKLMETSMMVGYMHLNMDDLDPALSMFRRALSLEKQVDNRRYRAMLYINMAAVHFRQERLDSALYYDDLALAESDTLQNDYFRGVVMRNASEAMAKMGDLEGGRRMLDSAIVILESMNNTEALGSAYFEMGEILLGMGKAQSALDWLEKGRATSLARGDMPNLMHTYRVFANAYDSLGRYADALAAHREYKRMADSVANEERLKQVRELEAAYETERKEMQIAGLTQQTQIQELKLSRRNLWVTVLVLALGAGALGGGVYLRQMRLRHARRQVDLEHKLLRTQMNPHFFFHSLTAIQDFIYKNQGPEAARYLTKFAKLMRLTLENSRAERISLKQEVSTLKYYLELQQMRMDHRFEFSLEVSDDLDAELTTIPPMFAQPFIENAIEHGQVHQQEGGKIMVRFAREGDLIRLEVWDNGVGLQEAKTKAAGEERTSMATQITRERLGLLNASLKRKIRLLVQDAPERGTQVILAIPLNA